MSSSVPATEFGLLSGLTTGGVGAAIVASLFIVYKICAKRNCKSHSSCVDIEISETTTSSATAPALPTAPPSTPILQPSRSPVPSAVIQMQVLGLDNQEVSVAPVPAEK
jgi:hypothetical protein